MNLAVLGLVFLCLVISGAKANSCVGQGYKTFECGNGTCINRNAFCNDETDCIDGSDEMEYNATLSDGTRCQYLSMIPGSTTMKWCNLPRRYKCDHELDCVNGWDECNCSHTFKCDGVGCALKVSFCDGKIDCADQSDEKLFDRATKLGFQCPVTRTHVRNNCILPNRYVCDGQSDCDHGIDECFCDFSSGRGKFQENMYSNDKCFRCLDGSLIIPNIFVCDGLAQCEDMSDECLCGKGRTKSEICNFVYKGDGSLSSCSPGSLKCEATTGGQQICVAQTSICDGTYDCKNQIDERYCMEAGLQIDCADGAQKVPKHQLCNGAIDCRDGSDEVNCSRRLDHVCKQYKGLPFPPFINVTDWSNLTQRDFVADMMRARGVALEFDKPLFTDSCTGIAFCANMDDQCEANCVNFNGTVPEYCKFVETSSSFRCPVSQSVIIGKEVCDGKPTCNDTTPHVSEDELYCPNRFYCSDKGRSRLPIHIPKEGQCNQIPECADQSDELNCNTSTHFYCKDSGSLLFIPRSKVCDGTKDCSGGSDECVNCNPNPFSSDTSLISSRVLIVFLWIIGLIAVFGNAANFIHQAKNLISPEGGQSKISRMNRILVLNLSLADGLVGIYLIALGIKDASVQNYCLEDQQWRSSSTCQALGTIAVIGTETSVFLLSIMTAYRLYLVVRPFKQQKVIIVKIAVVCAWCIALILSLVPFAVTSADYFVSCVWFRNNQFAGRICRAELESFTRNLILHSPGGNFSAAVTNGYSWSSMFAVMKLLNSAYVPERFFGFYSAHSVCLPRLFPDRNQDNSWGYSLFLILLNFFAFVFILISYVFIYRATTKKKVSKSSAEDRAVALQRKISRIVLTDFCCWIPICIMAFVNVSGTPVSDVSYAVSAIILIPINAAVNPFLYSDILDIIWELMLPLRSWFSSTVCGKKIESARQLIKHREPDTKKQMPYVQRNIHIPVKPLSLPETPSGPTKTTRAATKSSSQGTSENPNSFRDTKL